LAKAVIGHLSLVKVLSLFTFRNIVDFFRTNLLMGRDALKSIVLNHVYLETCSSTFFKRICPHPPTPSPIYGRRGARISKSLSHRWERDLG
jgi:hypothetical protein